MQGCDAAVAIVRASGPEDSVLLMRRTEREGDPWSGHWSFPGGRCEPEDSDLLCTALRELDEECGIRLEREHLQIALPATVARRRMGRFLAVAPFVLRVGTELPTVLGTSEAVEAQWVPIRRLTDPSQHRLLAIQGMPRELLFPSIHFDHIPLWGFTYRLITEWLGLLPADREAAGFRTANRLLGFLASRGLPVRQSWNGRTAVLDGVIPTGDVVDYLAMPDGEIPPVNVVEVRPESILVTGLEFEEYLIRVEGTHRA
jgi:8-oxo-dGTP pyrophosphatase MutT (NUDIX family)